MALKNFTEGENQKALVVLSCSAEFTAEVQGELIFLSIANVFLSITAVLGNALILVALRKETSLGWLKKKHLGDSSIDGVVSLLWSTVLGVPCEQWFLQVGRCTRRNHCSQGMLGAFQPVNSFQTET